jgi:hypothetical protein
MEIGNAQTKNPDLIGTLRLRHRLFLHTFALIIHTVLEFPNTLKVATKDGNQGFVSHLHFKFAKKKIQ